jgi:hypothetical protein
MSLTKLSLAGNIPARERLVSDIPARDRKIVNLFFTVYRIIVRFDSNDLSLLQSSKEDIMEAVLAMRSTWNPSTPLRIIIISSSSNTSSLTTRRPFSLVCRKKWRESKVARNKKNVGKT